MKEIKFRAWDKKNDKMYSSTIEEQEGFQFKNNEWVFCDFKLGVVYLHSDNGVLMQYTGLKDKNGKEIYEGDIYQHGSRRCVIKYVDARFIAISKIQQENQGERKWFKQEGEEVDLELQERNYGEIIGNIYENPELLNIKE